MEHHPPDHTLEAFEAALAQTEHTVYVLRLYITGTTSNSAQAVRNLTKLCQEHLAGRYALEVIDLYQQPALARADHIVAVPTLLKKLPPPVQTFIGNLADEHHLATRLGLFLVPGPDGAAHEAQSAQEERVEGL
ncbi:MAG: circadian clock KaiB family protein [Candidatus Tectimicrobiota bacterium]